MRDVVSYEPVGRRRNKNFLIASGTAAAVVMTSLLTWHAVQDREPRELCQSNRAPSARFPGDTDPSITQESRTWRLGVVILSGTPADTAGFVDRRVGFINPDDQHDVWHDSKPLVQKGGIGILVKLGEGPVKFSVYSESIIGSPNCKADPPTVFEPLAPLNTINDTHNRLVLPNWPS